MATPQEYEGYTARITISVANMFDGWDKQQLAGVDLASSVERYADLLTRHVQDLYPGLEVDIYVTEAGGYIRRPFVTAPPERALDAEYIGECIPSITDDLYSDSERWLVLA